eukprot:7128337-Alexandrium_andersonii.AAC.1
MSASLVGSEMCIRDRSSLDVADSPREHAGPAVDLVHVARRAQSRARLPACLLYTSDAADDM